MITLGWWIDDLQRYGVGFTNRQRIDVRMLSEIFERHTEVTSETRIGDALYHRAKSVVLEELEEHADIQGMKCTRSLRPTFTFLCCVALAIVPTVLIATDYYKLTSTKRIDQDLYRSGKILIETRYCYHYTYGEEALLKYEGSGQFSGSKIIWNDDSVCDVKKVITD